MALKVEYLKIKDIREYDRNARMHSPEQIGQIISSIDQFGFTNPILIDADSVLIAGHGRLAAATQLDMAEVPAIRLRNLSDKQVKALRIADNQLALNATWDLDLLGAEISELQHDEFDLDLLGFDEDFLCGLLDDDSGESMGDVDDSGAPGEIDDQQDAGVVVGPYKFNVKASDWSKWETELRAHAGFDSADIVNEIKKRLGFKG